MKTGKPVIEDAVFGFRAAAPAWPATTAILKKGS